MGATLVSEETTFSSNLEEHSSLHSLKLLFSIHIWPSILTATEMTLGAKRGSASLGSSSIAVPEANWVSRAGLCSKFRAVRTAKGATIRGNRSHLRAASTFDVLALAFFHTFLSRIDTRKWERLQALVDRGCSV